VTQSRQTARFKPYGVSPNTPRRTAERARYLFLFCISGIQQSEHRKLLGRTIIFIVMGDDRSMDENHAAKSFGANAEAVVNDDYATWRLTKIEKNPLFW
jgi:hypothetical protein